MLLTTGLLTLLAACDGGKPSDDSEGTTIPSESGTQDSEGSGDSHSGTGGTDDTQNIGPLYPSEATEGLTFGGAAPRNVLLITIDTLRRDYVGFYSGAKDVTPAIDRLLAEAVVLDNHYSCSNWTYPSMACLYSGRYNEDTGFIPRTVERYPDEPEMLAEILSAAGWHTQIVAAQQVFNSSYNINQGFEGQLTDADMTAPEVVAEAVQQAELLVGGKQPWLLHVHFLDPHIPYSAPESYRDSGLDYPGGLVDSSSRAFLTEMEAEWESYDQATRDEVLAELAGLYRGDVRYVDEAVGDMMSRLATLGALTDTLTVLLSDHGEQFYDHDRFEHGQDLHVEETLTLAAIAAPGLKPGRISAVTSHVDLLPTILAALGVDALPDEVDGAALGSFKTDRPVFTGIANEIEVGQSVQIGDDRLTYWWDGRAGFYELESDPGELQDQYAAMKTAADPRLDYLWGLLAPQTEAMDAALSDEAPSPVE